VHPKRRDDASGDDAVKRDVVAGPTGRSAALTRLQDRFDTSAAWQLALVLAYGAAAVWFLWDPLVSRREPPPLLNLVALIASVFVMVDVAVRVGARLLGRRST
jgi:hypothetical protein